VLAALIGLLTQVPARVGYHAFLKPHVPVAGIEGTLWHGTAAEASIEGIYLRDIEWRMRPLAIFTGKLSYAVSASSASGIVESQVVVSLSGDINLSQVTAAVPLYPFAGSLGLPGLSGVAQLRFERLEPWILSIWLFRDWDVNLSDPIPQNSIRKIMGFPRASRIQMASLISLVACK
jgi:hypothetical protein